MIGWSVGFLVIERAGIQQSLFMPVAASTGQILDQRTLTTAEPTSEEGKPSRLSMARYPILDSLRYRDFRWMAAGSFVSFLAMNMQMITRGWLILRLTNDSPLALVAVMVSFSLPMTFMSPFAGALADRLPRRHLVIFSQTGNAVMTVIIGLLDMTGVVTFWHVMAIGFVNGSLMAFNMPSRQAMLSEIVPEKSLMNAISLNNSGMNLTRIVGPASAGFLILIIGTHGVFLLVGAIYVFSVISTLMVDAGRTPATSSRKGVGGDIKEGLSYVAADPGRRGLVILMLITTLFGFSFWGLLPAWAREALNVQSDGLGILMTIMGAGALVGTLGLAAIPKLARRKGMILLGCTIVWGVALAMFSQTTIYWAAVPFLLIIGVISSVHMSMGMTMMQTLAAPEMRGRMMSIGMMTFGAMPLSSVPFGALAERIGTPNSLFLSGALLAAVALAFTLAYPAFRRVD